MVAISMWRVSSCLAITVLATVLDRLYSMQMEDMASYETCTSYSLAQSKGIPQYALQG